MEKNSEQTIIREARKRDVVSCFFSLLKEYPNEKIGDIFKRVEKHPAPRFYVTPEVARRHISIIAKKGKKALPLTNERKREMYFDIYLNWQKDCAEKGIEPMRLDGSFGYFVNVYNITENFLEQQAPSFYLDLETIKGLVYRELRRK